MPSPASAAELAAAFDRAGALRRDVERRERMVNRKVQALARGLAALMSAGDFHHRRGVGLHAFDVNGVVCLATSYLEEAGDGFEYRYAILSGGELARRALRTASLDPGASDPPGSQRRIALAAYDDFDHFLYRLPAYLADATRGWGQRASELDANAERILAGRRAIGVLERRRRKAAVEP